MSSYVIQYAILSVEFLYAATICLCKAALVQFTVSRRELEQGLVCWLAVICTFPGRVENVEEGASEMGLAVKREMVPHETVVCFGEHRVRLL